MQNKSRTYNSIINIIFSLGNQLITIFLNFFSRAIFIKILGAEYLGINGLFSDILMMLSLADLGLGSAMVYSFYKPLAEKNNKKIAALVKFYKKIYNFIAISITVIGISIMPFLNIIVKTDKPIANFKLYYILFLLNSVMSYLFVYKSSILNADQKGYIISTYSTIINSLRIIIQTIFLLMTKNYIIFLIIQIIGTFLNNLFLAYKANKIYTFINEDYNLEEEEKKIIFENIKSVFLYKLSGVLLNGTDNMIMSGIVGTIYVGYYSNYNLIIGTISKFITNSFSSLNASIGNLITDDEKEKRYKVFKILQTISFILGGICCICLYVLINDFIILWIGKEFLFDEFTLISILLNFYIAAVLPPVWSFREATGLFRKTKYIMLITAVINLIFSVVLGIRYGIGGIILASAIAKLSTYFWYEPIILFKSYFNKSIREYFFKHLYNVIILLVLTIICKIISDKIIVLSFIELFVKAIICFVIATAGYLMAYIRTNELKELLERVKNIVIRGK